MPFVSEGAVERRLAASASLPWLISSLKKHQGERKRGESERIRGRKQMPRRKKKKKRQGIKRQVKVAK